jgi:hypothetical protein
MLRQLHFARLDLELHSRFDPDGAESIFECDRRMASSVYPMMPLPEDRFLCAFAHIFAGALLWAVHEQAAEHALRTPLQAALSISFREGHTNSWTGLVPQGLHLFAHMIVSLARSSQ